MTEATFQYASNTTVQRVATKLCTAERVCITTHGKPDGDALGSVLALKRAIEQQDHAADIFLIGPVEPNLRAAARGTKLHVDETPDEGYDMIVVVDTGAWSQLDPLSDWLKPRHEKIVVIDHHARGADVGATMLIDTGAASATELLVDVLDAMGVDIMGGEGGIAEALFLGLATDTGWFKFSNADARTFAVASRLLRQGVDKEGLYQLIDENHPPRRLAIEAKALASVEFARDGAVAIMCLRPDDFKETGATLEDLTGLVNHPHIVGKVRVSILLTQIEPGQTKMSFRSKPAPHDNPAAGFTDVNNLAHEFGGGGHPHAAGARVDMILDDAREKLLTLLDD